MLSLPNHERKKYPNSIKLGNTPGDHFLIYCSIADNYKLVLATTNQGVKSYDWPLIADAELHTLEAVYDGARMILKLDGQTVVDVAANFTIQLAGSPRFFVAHRPGESIWKGTIYDMDIYEQCRGAALLF
jgi:hypothetical protein